MKNFIKLLYGKHLEISQCILQNPVFPPNPPSVWIAIHPDESPCSVIIYSGIPPVNTFEILIIGVGNGVFWGANFCLNSFRGRSRNFGRGWVKLKLLKINFRVVSEAQWAKAERPEVWGHLWPPEANRLYIWPQMHSELSSFDILQ